MHNKVARTTETQRTACIGGNQGATKEDAEKLLRSDSVAFGGGGIMSPFEEQRTPVACFKCRRLGHRARDCM